MGLVYESQRLFPFGQFPLGSFQYKTQSIRDVERRGSQAIDHCFTALHLGNKINMNTARNTTRIEK